MPGNNPSSDNGYYVRLCGLAQHLVEERRRECRASGQYSNEVRPDGLDNGSATGFPGQVAFVPCLLTGRTLAE